MPVNFLDQSSMIWSNDHALNISLLSGAITFLLVYGRNFFPSASLDQIDEGGHTISRTDQNAENPDTDNADASSGDHPT